MNDKQLKRTSKFLSLILRHQPEAIGLTLDPQGWAEIDELLAKAKSRQKTLSREILQTVVDTNDKKRFLISEDGKRIRANQGHSLKIDLGLQPVEPPEYLFHGTPSRFIGEIRKTGLKKMNRHHVHLSEDRITATKVGARRGSAVILTVRSGTMHREGMPFFVSENGVWLTDHVPVEFIEFKD